MTAKLAALTAAIVMGSLVTGSAQALIIHTPDSATSTAPGLGGGRTIDRVIDDSGLYDSAANIEDWYHDLSTGNTGLYYIGDRNVPGKENVVFTFGFNSPVDVDQIHFWTYDRLGDNWGREIKDFDISFSTDGGATFDNTIGLTDWLDRAGARITVDDASKIGHQSQSFTMQTGVTDIRFSNIVLHNDTHQYVGLSEVKFSVIPEPGTLGMLGLFGLALVARRRLRK